MVNTQVQSSRVHGLRLDSYPHIITTRTQHTAITSSIQSGNWVNPIQAKNINTLVKIPMKSRSPGVVGIGRNPRRSKEGDTVCHRVMAITIKMMVIQKMAVGTVHSIHASVRFMAFPLYTRPRAKPLAI